MQMNLSSTQLPSKARLLVLALTPLSKSSHVELAWMIPSLHHARTRLLQPAPSAGVGVCSVLPGRHPGQLSSSKAEPCEQHNHCCLALGSDAPLCQANATCLPGSLVNPKRHLTGVIVWLWC